MSLKSIASHWTEVLPVGKTTYQWRFIVLGVGYGIVECPELEQTHEDH